MGLTITLLDSRSRLDLLVGYVGFGFVQIRTLALVAWEVEWSSIARSAGISHEVDQGRLIQWLKKRAAGPAAGKATGGRRVHLGVLKLRLAAEEQISRRPSRAERRTLRATESAERSVFSAILTISQDQIRLS